MASPALGRGGYHGCALWPAKSRLQPRLSHKEALRRRAGRGRLCATAHTLSAASLAHRDPPRAHARPLRRTRGERSLSRQHRGSAATACTDNRAAQRPRWKHADCGQLSAERRCEVASRGSRHVGRGAERKGKGGGSPARAGRCALRCGRCGHWNEEGRSRRRGACAGSALPGPLLWRRSSAPGAPRGGGWGAPPRMRPGRGSAAPGRLGAERRCRLRSRAAACGTWAFSRSPRAQVADAPEPAQLPQLDRCCARAARRRRTARAPLPLPRRPPPRSLPAPPNVAAAPCCRPAQRELTRRRLLLWRRARTAISQAGRRGRARW